MRSVDSAESQMMAISSRNCNVVTLYLGTELNKLVRESLKRYWDSFGCNDFVAIKAWGTLLFVVNNVYFQPEEMFLESYERIYVSRIRRDSIVIGSHVFYKIKVFDKGDLYCKAIIAPHRNPESEKAYLKTDSVLCRLVCVRILLSKCALLC